MGFWSERIKAARQAKAKERVKLAEKHAEDPTDRANMEILERSDAVQLLKSFNEELLRGKGRVLVTSSRLAEVGGGLDAGLIHRGEVELRWGDGEGERLAVCVVGGVYMGIYGPGGAVDEWGVDRCPNRRLRKKVVDAIIEVFSKGSLGR